MMAEGYDLAEAIEAIDPAACSYEEWLQAGMALHAEGYGCDVWDSWSRRDGKRYHAGECEKKWRGFGSAPKPVKGGTLVQMAKDAGWKPVRDEGHALSWEDTEVRDDRAVLDPSWVEPAEIAEPAEWKPAEQLTAYLEALFDADEAVGYVTDSWQRDDGKWLPANKGLCDRTAGELIESISKYGDDFASALGKYNPEAGAWIRFNPLDGKGVRNDNVAEFRYALVESDSMDLGRQRAIIEELELPVAALVHSGGKSLHAIVRVDAKDFDEYRKRVEYLYRVCKENGLAVDTQNKNPSRLSRMPGCMRNGRKQWLVATGIGRESWADWREWMDELNDDLPDPESLAGVWSDMPELSPPLIDGVLRQGHKMLLAGPSKAGKSYALIELCVAIAEGVPWLGFGCAQGRVLYVNLELDRASCLHRFRDVYEAMGVEPSNLGSIDVWNLRGKSKPMDQLAPSLIRRALKTRPIAVVIDPIYKVITGDENSADQMAAFCNQFDKVCDSLGCAVVYCHHHSKGSQGQKRSMDRASGSGVFARDPDAMLDLIELEQTKALRKQQEDSAVCAALDEVMAEIGPAGWDDVIGPDDRLMAKHYMEGARAMLDRRGEKAMLDAVCAARKRAEARTAWRIEGTLREFPRFEPLNLWFDWPAHRPDETGVLADLGADGDEQARRQKGAEATAEKAARKQAEKVRLMRDALDECGRDGVPPTRAAVLERIGEIDGKPVSMGQLKEWTGKRASWSPIKIDPEKPGNVLADTEAEALAQGWEG